MLTASAIAAQRNNREEPARCRASPPVRGAVVARLEPYFLRNRVTFFSSSFFSSSGVYSRKTRRPLIGRADNTRFSPLPSLWGQADPMRVQKASGFSPSSTSLGVSNLATICYAPRNRLILVSTRARGKVLRRWLAALFVGVIDRRIDDARDVG